MIDLMPEGLRVAARQLIGSWRKEMQVINGRWVKCNCHLNDDDSLELHIIELKPCSLSGPATAGWIGKCEGCETLYFRVNGVQWL